jgi:hypothetical protein
LVLVVVGIAAYLYLSRRDAQARHHIREIAAGLFGLETAFLFFAGVGILSYSTPFFQVTPPIAELQRIVGNSLVGLNGGNVSDVRTFEGVGFYPNVNIGYSIRIFGVHDPLLPAAYYESWPLRAAAPNAHGVGLFVPDIDSVSLARRYGIAYVLTKAGVPVPPHMTTVAVIAGETLSKVPGSATFSFVEGRGDQVRSSVSNGDGAWTIDTSGPSDGELVFHVTAVPGLHATIDGRPLVLSSYDSVMLKARIPNGDHIINLVYMPTRLLLGVLLAALVIVAFSGAWLYGWARSRRRKREGHAPITATSQST